MRRVLLSVLALVLGCGSPAHSAVQHGQRAATAPLDWALLVPIETDAMVRIDLARLRRSPHRSAVQPWLSDLLGDVADAELEEAFESLIERTDVVLVAMLPAVEGEEEEIVLLAQGSYGPREIERLNASSSDPSGSRAIDVGGYRVWIGTSEGDQSAIVQLRPDTLALTGSIESMNALVARTRMAPGARRWPPALRPLVEATGLERATIGLAFANQSFGDEEVGMTMSIAGRADLDGPLDVELVVEMGDPALAEMAAALFSGFLDQLARSGEGDDFAMRQIAELARIEARGSRIRGTIHAERSDADQLVPALLGLLSDDFAPRDPPVMDPALPHTL